jgi:hypothetical protein
VSFRSLCPELEKGDQFEVHLPVSQFGNITVNSAIEEKIRAVTLCFWMRSQSRGLRVLYNVLHVCKMIVGIGIYAEANVVISILGNNW